MQCGAITAESEDHSKLEYSIIKELNSLRLKPGESNIEGVKTNVNNQVDFALKIFEQQVKNKELLIVGAVYDFTNEMHHGAGKVNIINIQGKRQAVK